MSLSAAQYDLLERAVARAQRLVVTRRGTPWIVLPQQLVVQGGTERLLARHPSTGEAMDFAVEEIDRVEVLR